MKEEVKRRILKQICNSHLEVLLVGLEEYKDDFIYTSMIIDFMTRLNEMDQISKIDNVFTDTFIDRMYVETSNYIGR